MSNLADRLFAVSLEWDGVEHELYRALKEILGRGVWGRLTVDPHDCSFEAYGYTPFDIEPTPEQLAAIGKLGFKRFWLHSESLVTPRLSNQRYFCTSVDKETK